PDVGYNTNVAFAANAPVVAFPGGNLVPEDTNGVEDMFVTDLSSGETARVSVDSSGAEGHGANPGTPPLTGAGISGDGRVIAFSSYESDLVPSDTNGTIDVFVRGPTYGGGDLTGDGDSSDVVLQTINGTTGAVTTYCPAGIVKVHGSDIAFLRPETQGNAT